MNPELLGAVYGVFGVLGVMADAAVAVAAVIVLAQLWHAPEQRRGSVLLVVGAAISLVMSGIDFVCAVFLVPRVDGTSAELPFFVVVSVVDLLGLVGFGLMGLGFLRFRSGGEALGG